MEEKQLIAVFYEYSDTFNKHWISQRNGESKEDFLKRAYRFAGDKYHVDFCELNVNIY